MLRNPKIALKQVTWASRQWSKGIPKTGGLSGVGKDGIKAITLRHP
jgi:hypothetical protein